MNNELLQPLSPENSDILSPLHSGRSTMFREKLVDLFEPTDWVRVINPDSIDFIWQYMPASKEHITFDSSSSTVPMKITHRDDPEVYRLEPGQSAVLVGANAYLMIEGLAKRMMANRTINRNPNVRPGEARNFNFSDDEAQHELIELIYLGKATPGLAPKPAPDEGSTTDLDQIDDDLGLTSNGPKKRGGRPRKANA